MNYIFLAIIAFFVSFQSCDLSRFVHKFFFLMKSPSSSAFYTPPQQHGGARQASVVISNSVRFDTTGARDFPRLATGIYSALHCEHIDGERCTREDFRLSQNRLEYIYIYAVIQCETSAQTALSFAKFSHLNQVNCKKVRRNVAFYMQKIRSYLKVYLILVPTESMF